MTPTKALKVGATLMMWKPTNDAAWVAQCQAATERLKVKEAAVKVGMSAQEGAEAGDAAREPGRVEAAPGATRLDGSGRGGHGPGFTERTPEAVEAGKAETSARIVGQAGVGKTKEVVETPQDGGKELEGQQQQQQQQPWQEPQQPVADEAPPETREEKKQPKLQMEREEPQQQQPSQPQPEAKQPELGQPEKPVAEAEQEVTVPPPNAPVEAPAGEGVLLPQGSMLIIIDLTSEDSPSDKGKQKVDIKMVGASSQPGTSAAPDDNMVEASTRWPNFAELALMRMEEEVPP
jgi:hypothetical protein